MYQQKVLEWSCQYISTILNFLGNFCVLPLVTEVTISHVSPQRAKKFKGSGGKYKTDQNASFKPCVKQSIPEFSMTDSGLPTSRENREIVKTLPMNCQKSNEIQLFFRKRSTWGNHVLS
jgi:hypothetical protein